MNEEMHPGEIYRGTTIEQGTLEQDIERLQAQIKKLKEALQYYADGENIGEVRDAQHRWVYTVDDDYEDLARKTLEEVSKM